MKPQNEMQIFYRDADELVPYARNAKKHPPKQVANIARSLIENGWRCPVLIHAGTGEIIAGHGRVMAVQEARKERPELGRVPCIDGSDMTPEQIRKYRILDNKLNESEWDSDMLELDCVDLDFSGFDIDLKIDPVEIDEIGSDIDKNTDLDDIPEASQSPTVQRGDVWALGRHKLMCGDSTDEKCVKTLMGGCNCNLFITDPPYGVSLGMKGNPINHGRKVRRTDGKNVLNDDLNSEDLTIFLSKVFASAKSFLLPGGAFYIWYASNNGFEFLEACKKSGLTVRQNLIWVKNRFTLGRQDYQWKHEPCLYGWKEGAAHTWNSDRKQSTVLEFERPIKSQEHPTMKPVALFEYLIKNSSKKDDVVLDLFCGSGTTIVACEKLGRTAYAMELSPEYCDTIIQRYENLTGDKAVLIERM